MEWKYVFMKCYISRCKDSVGKQIVEFVNLHAIDISNENARYSLGVKFGVISFEAGSITEASKNLKE